MRYYYLITFVLLSISACNYNHQVTNDISFDDIIKCDGINCIIINDSSNISNDDFLQRLSAMKITSTFNFIDVRKPTNYWYYKLLVPQILPITCVISKGVIIDLIPGYSNESILYVKEVVTQQKMSEEFHFNQLYGYEKSQKIDYLNEMLSLKHAIDCENFSTDLIPLEVTEPYALYLCMKGFSQIGDTLLTKIYASKLLEHDSVRSIAIYEEEIAQARKILDNDYGVNNLPQIATHDTITINCQVLQAKDIYIDVLNKGNNKLIISDIHTSCTCLEYMGANKKIYIEPMSSISLPFLFRSDVAGNLYREVYIASNSINAPISKVTIVAKVNNSEEFDH